MLVNTPISIGELIDKISILVIKKNNIIDVQVFLTNMKEDFKTYNKIYAEYFKDNQPCRTTIEIKSLPTPIAIELKVIATI